MGKFKIIILSFLSLPVIYLLITYFGIADRNQLTSKTWHSSIDILVAEDAREIQGGTGLKNMRRISVNSDIRYLIDGSYIQNSVVKSYDEQEQILFSMDFSDVGNWEYEQGYLFLESGDVRGFTNSDGTKVDEDSINKFKEIFFVYMVEARRMNTIGENMMLMTSVSNSSRLWVASP